MQHRRARRGGLLRIDHRRQLVDLERHRFGRVARRGRRLGHHAGDRLAHIADPIRRQRRVRQLRHRRAIPIFELEDRLHGAEARSLEVGSRVDGEDAGHRAGGLRVDAPDGAMGVRAAQEGGIGLARQVDVVRVAPFAAHQHRILLAGNRLSTPNFMKARSEGVWSFIGSLGRRARPV